MLSTSVEYIVKPLLNKYVFSVYDCSKAQIQSYANIIFDTYLKKENFEACAFALHLMIDGGKGHEKPHLVPLNRLFDRS